MPPPCTGRDALAQAQHLADHLARHCVAHGQVLPPPRSQPWAARYRLGPARHPSTAEYDVVYTSLYRSPSGEGPEFRNAGRLELQGPDVQTRFIRHNDEFLHLIQDARTERFRSVLWSFDYGERLRLRLIGYSVPLAIERASDDVIWCREFNGTDLQLEPVPLLSGLTGEEEKRHRASARAAGEPLHYQATYVYGRLEGLTLFVRGWGIGYSNGTQLRPAGDPDLLIKGGLHPAHGTPPDLLADPQLQERAEEYAAGLPEQVPLSAPQVVLDRLVIPTTLDTGNMVRGVLERSGLREIVASLA